MIDEIPFNDWSQESIDHGWKECTSRHRRYAKDKRVYYITPKLPLWFIKKYLWKAEGANSPEELQSVFNGIYKREVPGTEMFYVHFGYFSKEMTP